MSLKPRKIDFKQTWGDLLETVKGVITCSRIQRATWNDRFSDVYALCVANPDPFGEDLYKATKKYLKEHVTNLLKTIESSDDLLATYQRSWEQFVKGATYLNSLYGYLNTQYINKRKYSEADMNYGGFVMDTSENLMEIGELALETWKKQMIEPLKKQLQDLLLAEIQSDRVGGAVNQSVIHGVIDSFVSVEQYKTKQQLELYEKLFESRFLKETGEYYAKEAVKLLQDNNCSQYMEKVIQRLDDEDLRSRKFLHPTSYNKVSRECELQMVEHHIQTLHAECHHMVEKEKRQDLSNMYRLLNPIPAGVKILVNEVQSHIKKSALSSVEGLKGENIHFQFVDSMLEVHSKFTELIQSVFNNDQHFISALDQACQSAINYRSSSRSVCKSPELVAKYCDILLKKSQKGMSEIEVDNKLTSSITVFKYLDDKDIFQRFYARMLARRLIYGQSQSMDAEEAMINRLKQACGYEFTSKLHRMFTDMSISSDLNTKFTDFLKVANIDLPANFSILVLTAGSWPIGQSNLPTFAIPSEVEGSLKNFELFYNKSFNGRKLAWMHSLATAELRLNYLKRQYLVTMGTFQMAVMLLFNGPESLSFQEIMATTQLPEKELAKQIQTLIETKLLTCKSSSEEETKSPTQKDGSFNNSSMFILNQTYNNKRTKFKIITTAHKESAQESETTHSAVDEDRKMYLQAAIVRVMKARKILKHNLLIQEVISQSRSRFSPSISMIKKCIESLIDKQYIERTPNSTDEYAYVA